MIKCFLTELGQNMTWCKQSHYMWNGLMAVDWQMANAHNISFILSSSWNFDPFQLILYQISTLKITMSLSVTSSLGENERE